ncbi:NADH dehydrogenase 1 beta subcomplex subunit 8 [Hibiscus syriacus]|uniref:NADH dehydrogenase 1 beta subcomplex subunit 8 n=1 Tax=Hibiscus syriacus TaxID=106335 RepID=A0A6A3CNV0_HIBSY|nr:NADH dehydrogenase 1 beta subcomplex subunit 8 [Hibiscus syriacus]
MTRLLSNVASKIMGRNDIVSRSSSSSLRIHSGMGLPVGKRIVPEKPLPVNDELIWDNGTTFPEPCIDRIADIVGKYKALAWMCGGLSFFTSLGILAWWNDKAYKILFAPKVYPYDNLRWSLVENQCKGVWTRSDCSPELPVKHTLSLLARLHHAFECLDSIRLLARTPSAPYIVPLVDMEVDVVGDMASNQQFLEDHVISGVEKET